MKGACDIVLFKTPRADCTATQVISSQVTYIFYSFVPVGEYIDVSTSVQNNVGTTRLGAFSISPAHSQTLCIVDVADPDLEIVTAYLKDLSFFAKGKARTPRS